MGFSFYDITKDPAYQAGFEKGFEQGFKIGEETMLPAIERLLLKKTFSDFYIAEATDVPLSLVESIKEELIVSGKLKE